MPRVKTRLKPFDPTAGATKRRIKNKARSTYGNFTSKPAGRGRGEGKFGRPPPMTDDHQIKAIHGATLGFVGGAMGATVTPTALDANRKQRHSERLKRQIKNNERKLDVSKSRYKITDVGTKANAQWPHKGKIIGATVGGAAAGGGLVHGEMKGFQRHYTKKIKRQKTMIESQKEKLKTMNVNKSSTSAFGVDHGQISKAEKKKPYGKNPPPTIGRRASAAVFGIGHSAVAGKEGKKLAATGSTFGHQWVGRSLGTGGALALTRGKSASAVQTGSGLGSQTGKQYAVNSNTRKGRYKKET